jgi:hypothetical protein
MEYITQMIYFNFWFIIDLLFLKDNCYEKSIKVSLRGIPNVAKVLATESKPVDIFSKY